MVIIILLSISILISSGFLCAFLWSVKDGQYEDNITPAQRMLFDSSNNKNVKQ